MDSELMGLWCRWRRLRVEQIMQGRRCRRHADLRVHGATLIMFITTGSMLVSILRPDPRLRPDRAEAEAAEAARAAAAAELERRRAAKAQLLPEEPPAGAPATALVRVRLPNGQNFQRRCASGR